MKSWLAKFRISNALDSREGLPRSIERNIAASDSLRRFREDSAVLDRALRQKPKEFVVPPALHSSIMRALQETRSSATLRTVSVAWRWAAAAAIAAIAATGILWPRHRPAPAARPDTLALVANALDAGDELTQEMPGAVLAPLSDECARLGRDVNNTKEFLIANLP